jgi:hypothetical protein
MSERPRFQPFQLLDDRLLNGEIAWRREVRARHVSEVHGGEPTRIGPGPILAGTTVGHHSGIVRLAFDWVAGGLRQARVIVGDRVRMKLSSGAGQKPDNHAFGRLATERLGVRGLVFPTAKPKPETPRPLPFRLHHRAYDNDEGLTEAMVLEVARPVGDQRQIGFSIGRVHDPVLGGTGTETASQANLFMRELTVLSGGGVRVAGRLEVRGRVIEQSPEAGAGAGPQPTQEDLIAAWLRTPEGQAERKRIEQEAEQDFTLKILKPKRKSDPPRIEFRYRVTNGTTMPMRNLHAYTTAVTAGQNGAPVWYQLPPPPTSTVVKDGGTVETSAEIALATSSGIIDLRVFVAGNATYDVPVTAFAIAKGV